MTPGHFTSSRTLLLGSVLGVAGVVAFAQQNPRDLETLKVQGSVYMIANAGGNIAVQVGGDGVLVVDTGLEPNVDKVLAAIKGIAGDKPIRYVINTHVHADHTGGNGKIKAAGQAIIAGNVSLDVGGDRATGAMLIAHENVLNRMSAPTGTQAPTPSSAWPTDTFFTDEDDIFFNNEAVQLFSQPPAHTDGDILAFFRTSDVVATGDVFVTTSYPIVDLQRGGNINGVIAALNRIIDITVPRDKQEGGTMVIPGHGRICDEADVVEYRDMVTIIRDRVQKMIKDGMTLDRVKAARPTRDYDGRYGSPPSPADGSARQATARQPSQDSGLPSRSSPSSSTSEGWTTDMFVEAVYRSLSQPSSPAPKR